MSDAEQRLADVRAAINDVLTKGQRLRKGDREVQRAELAQLRVLESEYAARAAAESAAAKSRGRNRIRYLKI